MNTLNYISPVFFQDAYKAGHPSQYLSGTEFVYSNLTARGSKHFNYKHFQGKVVWVGGRQFVQDLKEMFDRDFFSRPEDEVVGRYTDMVNSALGGKVDTYHLRALHRKGYLPIKIKSLKEGRLVNLRIPLMTVRNSVEGEFAWLVNFLETLWSSETWAPATEATIAYEYRRLAVKWAKHTGAPDWFTSLQCHDFSARGLNSVRPSMTAAVGHALSSMGSDTLACGEYITRRYGVDWKDTLILCAPPATEHAVMCMLYAYFGDGDMSKGELKAFEHLITKVYPKGMIAIVSDTLDFFNVLTNVAEQLKPTIMSREDGGPTDPGKLVFRPDSGDPYKIICGDNNWLVLDHTKPASDFVHAAFDHYFPASESGKSGHLFTEPQKVVVIESHPDGNEYWELTFRAGEYGDYPGALDPADVVEFSLYNPTPEEAGALQCLWDNFPGEINDAGYRTLDSHVGLIYGDSITLELADRIWARMAELGWASNAIVFGVGSFTYQYNTRDTFGLAIKATWAQIEGKGYDLQKTPKTDDGTKHSAKGLLRVELDDGEYVLYQSQTWEQEDRGELETIFEDGVVMNLQTLDEMREHLWPTKVPSPDRLLVNEDE